MPVGARQGRGVGGTYEMATLVYDGKEESKMTKDELVKAILREYEVIFDKNTIRAMDEAFRCGFLRGENYAREDERAKTKAKALNGSHICKYCGEITKGTDDDVLCPECRGTFGHAFYSEL
jgi:rubrerythrin